MIDLDVLAAQHDLFTYGDIEPLCKLIENGNATLWNNKELRYWIAQIVRGDVPKHGRGHRTKTAKLKDERDFIILSKLYFWNGFGLPIWGKNNTLPNACEQVSSEMIITDNHLTPLTPESIWKHVWQKHTPTKYYLLYKEFGNQVFLLHKDYLQMSQEKQKIIFESVANKTLSETVPADGFNFTDAQKNSAVEYMKSLTYYTGHE